MAGRAIPFLVFPMVIMLVAILMNSTAPAINGSATASFCSNPSSSVTCQQPSGVTTVFCVPANIIQAIASCQILPHCSAPPYPSPAYCVNDLGTALAAGCFFQFVASGSAGCPVFLPSYASVVLTNTQLISSLSTSSALFAFSVSGTSGFIAIIGVAVGIISLLGLTIFSSGLQGESLHVLFIGGMVLGLWLLLSGIEGFAGGTSDMFFSAMNVAIAGAGTFFYVIMTFSVVIGFTGLVSRGS